MSTPHSTHLQESLLHSGSRGSSHQEDLPQDSVEDSAKLAQSFGSVGGTSFLSSVLFRWVNPLLKHGQKNIISLDCIPSLPASMKSSLDLNRCLEEMASTTKSSVEGLTLIKVLIKAFKGKICMVLLLTLVATSMNMYFPILTNQIVEYIEEGKQRQLSKGLIFLCLIFVLMPLIEVIFSHMWYQFGVLSFSITNTLSLMIFSKSFKYPHLSEKQYDISKIVNLSEVDAAKMEWVGYNISFAIFTPFQMIIGIYLMYVYIGVSCVSGIGVLALIVVATSCVSRKLIDIYDEILVLKDARMKVTQQMLDNIRHIKINAIEKYFFRRINKKREEEMKMIKKRVDLDTIQIFLYQVASPLILSATFLTYTLLGNQLTANISFPIIMIFSILQTSIRQFPEALTECIQMYASIKRIQTFLALPEITSHHIQTLCPQQPSNSNQAVQITDGHFYWGTIQTQKIDQPQSSQNRQKEHFQEYQEFVIQSDKEGEKKQRIEGSSRYVEILSDINICFEKGKLTLILGDIGSGKSSLLNAILNEMKADEKSKIKIDGSIGYSPQKSWMMSTNIKNNITFSLPYEEQKFKQAVYYSCLEKDLELLADGLMTEIGQKGINLSGGQKARISLARTLYSQRDIYLLDDIISAVDVHVAEFIMQETILKYLAGKTVIMSTHAIQYSSHAHHLIVLKKGRVLIQGTYQTISQTSEFKQLLAQEQQHDSQLQEKEDEKIMDQLAKMKQFSQKKSYSLQKREETSEIAEVNQKKPELDKIIEELMLPEDHFHGEIEGSVLLKYIKLNGGRVFLFLLVTALALWVAFNTTASISIQKLTQNPAQHSPYLYIYLAFSILSSFFIAFEFYLLFTKGVKQGLKVHRKIIKSLLYASLTKFFNRVPAGRIINRLTKDLGELDEQIAFSIAIFLLILMHLVSCLIICVYSSSPYLIIVIVVFGVVCQKIKSYYLKCHREIVRLEKISTSPIVSGFMAGINGLSTIRSYGNAHYFLEEQLAKIDVNKKVKLTKIAQEQWMTLALTMASTIITIGAVGYCMIFQNNPSLAGLLMSYALTLKDNFVGATEFWAKAEISMISLERLYCYMRLSPEKGYKKLLKKWKSKEEGYDMTIMQEGGIQFKNVCIKYREDLPLVLNNICLKIKGGEKVGIVGRTGSGKSTLVNSLLRLAEVSSGSILIDGKNIVEYGLKDFRNAITMIDQEPIILNASFRENLDLTQTYTHQELTDILKQCSLYEIVQSKGGLDALISKDSLSTGEKQLLCICRAFLKKSKIVLIDEATANIDLKNDQLIQQVIQHKFKNSTVITIAHRLSTLKNSDKILVLGEQNSSQNLKKGVILEWGTYAELIAKEDGIFAKMLQNT